MNMSKKKSILRPIILVAVLVVAVALGFAIGAFKPEAFFKEWRIGMDKILRLLAMVAGVLLTEWILELIFGRFKPESHRLQSILTITRSLLRYAAAIVILCWGLTILGVNITAVVASVGILALIVGFSAESMIADMVTGVFILFESQYNVGDIVEVNGFRGTVTDIGIRTTSITDSSENIKIINYADMRNILNRSDHVSRAVGDISIPYETDLEKLEASLPELLHNIYEMHKNMMDAEPVYLGVQALADSAIVLRFCVAVPEGSIYKAMRTLNHDLLLGFRKLGVECPFPQLDVHGK